MLHYNVILVLLFVPSLKSLVVQCCCCALSHVRVTVPPAVLKGETAILQCLFDLEGDSLYSVKWYKGRREFYRFTPKEDPAMKVFHFPGLHVEESKSDATHLTLKHVQLSMSGKYSCEVSADSPSFHTALVTGEMDIVETPRESPQITGIRPRYKLGERLLGNCSSSWSKPATKLTWFINNEQAPTSVVVTYPPVRDPRGERERSTLGINLHINPEYFTAGRLKIRCSASIHDIYWKSTEKSIEEDKPKNIVKVHYPYTDRPPAGRHHFDENQITRAEVPPLNSGSDVLKNYSVSVLNVILIICLHFPLLYVIRR